MGRTSISSAGTIHVHRARGKRNAGEDKPTKTKLTRRFTLEPEIVPVLQRMKDEADAAGLGPTDHVLDMQSERTMSRALKRWMRRAEVKRPELHATDATRQAMRFHDLRASGITWMAVRVDAPQVIQSRAGHTDYTTTLGYIREAETTLAEGFGEVFPALPVRSATDWAKDRAKSRRTWSISIWNLQRGGRDSNPRPPA